MRAIQVIQKGIQPEVTSLPLPTPEPQQVRIRIVSAALNFADLLMIEGSYQDTPDLPFTLGLECAGVIDAVGVSVSGFEVGDRVAAFLGQGALADYAIVSTDRLIRLPDAVDFDAGAAFQIAYGTSHLALARRARLRPGETVAVLGASGGVGLTAVEIAHVMGARVIAAARGTKKCAIAADAGADEVLDTDMVNLTEAMKELGGIDVLYDPVGGTAFGQAMRAMRPEGRLLTIGFASGTVPEIKANHLLVKNLDVIGLYWGGYLRFNPASLVGSLNELVTWIADGTLTPHISHRLPLEDAVSGLELLRTRQATGKVVINP